VICWSRIHFFRFGVIHRLGQQIEHIYDFDAAIEHFGHEVKMIALGVFDPQDVVEQQPVTVGRCQPRMGQARRADHDFTQLADF
jgi:hypothetical protein